MENLNKNVARDLNEIVSRREENKVDEISDGKLVKQLDDLITGLGGLFVGFSNVLGMLPQLLIKYPYAITYGVRLSDAIIDEIGLRIMSFLQNNSYNAYTIAASQSVPDAPEPYSGVFPHKTGAVASGQGWIGKNGLFIHNDFGPRVRLGTVLTDLKLPCENKILESKCFSCNKCVEACPAMALTGKAWHIGVKREEIVDARACSEYMNKNFKHIGRGSVCGICIKVCPF